MSKLTRQKVASPCVGNCQLIVDNTCMGCFRLISEIGGWLNKPESEKSAIVIRCQQRKADYLRSHEAHS